MTNILSSTCPKKELPGLQGPERFDMQNGHISGLARFLLTPSGLLVLAADWRRQMSAKEMVSLV